MVYKPIMEESDDDRPLNNNVTSKGLLEDHDAEGLLKDHLTNGKLGDHSEEEEEHSEILLENDKVSFLGYQALSNVLLS